MAYSIWLDANAAIYVKIEDNDAPTKSPGSTSNLAFSVAAAVKGRVEGYDAGTGQPGLSRDNNVKAFVQAVVENLMNGGTNLTAE